VIQASFEYSNAFIESFESLQFAPFFSSILETSFEYNSKNYLSTEISDLNEDVENSVIKIDRTGGYKNDNVIIDMRHLVQSNFVNSFFKHAFENNSENQCNNNNEEKANNNASYNVLTRECSPMEILQLSHAFFFFDNEIVNSEKNGITNGSFEIKIVPSTESNYSFESKKKNNVDNEIENNSRKKIKFDVDVTGHCKKSLNRIKIDFTSDLQPQEILLINENQWLRKKIESSIEKVSKKKKKIFFWNEIDGNLNTKTFTILISKVLSVLSQKPGCQIKSIYAAVQALLNLSQTAELLILLQDIGTIYCEEYKDTVFTTIDLNNPFDTISFSTQLFASNRKNKKNKSNSDYYDSGNKINLDNKHYFIVLQ
jgi:hypothetical protein